MSVSRAALSAFVREHSTLNLTQSKALTEQLLSEYVIVPTPPADPNIPVEVGQLWLHTASRCTLRVTDVESGPIYVPADPVTSWGPQSVSWQNPDDHTAAATTPISLWRQQMYLIPDADQPSTTTPTSSTESETTP